MYPRRPPVSSTWLRLRERNRHPKCEYATNECAVHPRKPNQHSPAVLALVPVATPGSAFFSLSSSLPAPCIGRVRARVRCEGTARHRTSYKKKPTARGHRTSGGRAARRRGLRRRTSGGLAPGSRRRVPRARRSRASGSAPAPAIRGRPRDDQ